MALQAQTHGDLVSALKENIRFLELSCGSYDDGFYAEAKRMATVIRVLLNDTDNSISLLTQLNLKDLKFYSTPHQSGTGNLLKGSFLFRERLYCDGSGGMGMNYVPRLDDLPPVYQWKTLSFDNWWNEFVLVDSKEEKFSRKELVLALANKYGGAHVDPRVDSRFMNLSKQNSIGFVVSTIYGEKAPDNKPELVCVRQIAFELLKTLKEQLIAVL